MNLLTTLSSHLIKPDGEIISSAEDTDVKMSILQWEEVKEKIRLADLYRIAIATIARGRGKKFLTVPIKALRETEAAQYGLIFSDDGKDMTFIAVEPPGSATRVN